MIVWISTCTLCRNVVEASPLSSTNAETVNGDPCPARDIQKVGEDRRRHQPWEEADEDAMFAAAVLGALHNTARDTGNLFRVVGDTTGALIGGSVKAVSATVKVTRPCAHEASALRAGVSRSATKGSICIEARNVQRPVRPL